MHNNTNYIVDESQAWRNATVVPRAMRSVAAAMACRARARHISCCATTPAWAKGDRSQSSVTTGSTARTESNSPVTEHLTKRDKSPADCAYYSRKRSPIRRGPFQRFCRVDRSAAIFAGGMRMYTLYYSPGAASLAVHLALLEAGAMPARTRGSRAGAARPGIPTRQRHGATLMIGGEPFMKRRLRNVADRHGSGGTTLDHSARRGIGSSISRTPCNRRFACVPYRTSSPHRPK